MDVTVDDRNVSGPATKPAGRFMRITGALSCLLLALFLLAMLSILRLDHDHGSDSAHRNIHQLQVLCASLLSSDHAWGGLNLRRFDWLGRVNTIAARFIASANASFLLLFIALSYSVSTDMRRGKILNAVTYPTMALAIGLNAYASLVDQAGLPVDAMTFHAGTVGLVRSLLVGLTCFVLMFVSFLTAGGGGGDVKLATVIGLIVGPYVGVLALAYSYIAAGVYLFAFFAAWRIIEIMRKAFTSETLRRTVPRVANLLRDNAFARWHSGMNGCVRMAPFFLIGTCVAVLEGAIR